MYSVMTSHWWCDSQRMAGKHFDYCWQDVIGQQLKWLVPQETVIRLHYSVIVTLCAERVQV